MLVPIGSMYGIFTYIYHKNQPIVGSYTIHGWGLYINQPPYIKRCLDGVPILNSKENILANGRIDYHPSTGPQKYTRWHTWMFRKLGSMVSKWVITPIYTIYK